MSPVGGALEYHDHEFDEVQWSNAEQSCQTLTHQNEINIVEKAIAMVSQPA